MKLSISRTGQHKADEKEIHARRSDLDAEQQGAVGVLQLLLPLLHLFSPLLLLLQLTDVIHRCLQDGALVPAHLTAHKGLKCTDPCYDCVIKTSTINTLGSNTQHLREIAEKSGRSKAGLILTGRWTWGRDLPVP